MSFFFNLLGSGGGASLFYPSTDKAILAGVGASPLIGYIGTFGDSDNDPDDLNIIYTVGRWGSDHNSALTDGSIRIFRSTDGGVTQSAVVTLRTPVASFNVTNPCVQVIKSGPNKGRVIVNWSKMRGPLNYELTGPSDVTIIYSDNAKSVGDFATATWSGESKMFPEIGEKNTTSTTSINLGTVGLTQSLTIGTGLTNIYVGRRIKIASNANSNNNIVGRIVSYNSGTGAAVVDNIVVGGSGTLNDWNVSLSSYGDSVGKAVTLSDNSLLKVMHWTEGAGFNGYVYSSTDGITWTYKGTVWTNATEGSGDSHEASLAIQPSTGDIYCYRRNTDLAFIQMSKSTAASAGAVWSAVVQTTVPNIGKCPFLFTSSGKIVGIGRSLTPDFYSILWQSNDGGLTHTWQNIDGREARYQYGGMVKLSDKILARYAIEAIGGTEFQGPSLMIQKEIIESTTAISPPTVYDSYFQSLLDFAIGNGEAVPNEANYDYFSDFIAGIKSDGMLAEHDVISIFMLNDNTLTNFACRNWRKGWEAFSQVASPSYGTNGFTFNGTTSYLSGKNMNLLTKFLQNDASVSCYIANNVNEDGGAFGAGDGTFGTYSNATWLRPRVTGYATFGVNNFFAGPIASYAGSVLNSDSSGFWKISRTAATVSKLYQNGNLLLTNNTTASSGMASRPMIVGAVSFNGSINHFGTKIVSYIDIGSAMDGYEATKLSRFNTLKIALGL